MNAAFTSRTEIQAKKNNKRTLRKRIRKTIYTVSLINMMIYSVIIILFFAILVRPLSGFASNFISNNIAEQMNSKPFLMEHGIQRLEDFNPDTPRGRQWIERMDGAAKLQTYIPSSSHERQEGSADAKPHGDFDFVSIEVSIKDKIIYSNKYRLTDLFGMSSNKLIDYYSIASVYPLLNERGETIGSVTAIIAPQLTIVILLSVIALFLFIVCIPLCLTHIISRLISYPVMKPLEHLNCRIRAIAQEDDETAMNTQIELVKPLREIEELADAANLIMQKMKDYNERLQNQKSRLEEQNEELEAQNEELTESKRKLQEAQDSLIARERSIRNLMDNAGQGFLTFGPDLLVDEEYSKECESIFGHPVGHAGFADLMALGDREQCVFLENLLQKIFSETDSYRRNIYISLLPDELTIGDRHIAVEYKMINRYDEDQTAMMAILTDNTEKHLLQSQMDAERNILKMVVKVIVNYGDFTDCVRDYKTFADTEMKEIMCGSGEPRVKLLQLYRDIHTYKGNFSQFGLVHVTARLHEAESELTAAIKREEGLNKEAAEDLVQTFRFHAWLEEDMQVLQSVLGDSFFNQQDLLLIDKSKIMEIEKKMMALLAPNECKLLLPDLRKLRYKPFKELLKGYPDVVESLSERLEKFVHPFAVEGDDFDADTEKYYDFSRSLTHVFRNIMDHAIEPMEERIAAGKDELGTIRCLIRIRRNHVVLSISDDGRGMDPDVIRRRAAEKGFLDKETLNQMKDNEVIELIFLDQFSTKDQVSDISGRGIGLSSVKAETEKLGGRVEVHSVPGEGTEFRFILPYEDLSGLPDPEIPAMLQPSLSIAGSYFQTFISVPLEGEKEYGLYPSDKLPLHQVSSFVTLKGAVEGKFVLSIDHALSQVLVQNMVLEPLSEDEEEQLLEDCLAEASNIILGNSFSMFGSFADYIIMEPPITIRTEGASVKVADSDIWTCLLNSAYGCMRLSFVLTRR